MIKIEHIDQIMDAISGNSYFIKVVKDGYTVFNYIAQTSETFPTLDKHLPKEEYERRMLLRECRGILFGEDGKPIRRPYQKFLNYGQDQFETENANFNDPHHILRKYDGSNISPFRLRGKLEFGTKMGITDVCKPVYKFVEKNTNIRDISEYLVDNGFTPNFEWCSPRQRIVLNYDQDDMVLTGVRKILTGEYMPYEEMVQLGEMFGVHVVETFGQVRDIEKFLEDVNNLKDEEGFIVRWNDGFAQKFKALEYLDLHRITTDTMSERIVLANILNDKVDDIAPKLPDGLREKFLDFHSKVFNVIIERVADIKTVVEENQGLSVSDFFKKYNGQFGLFDKVYFAAFRSYNGNFDTEMVMDWVIDTMKKYLYRKEQIEQNRSMLNGLRWEHHWLGDID